MTIEQKALEAVRQSVIAIEAYLAALPTTPVSVGVKPLVWDEHYTGSDFRGGERDAASSLFGRFEVYGDGSWSDKYNFHVGKGNLTTAKAAAQADYEARILSVLAIDDHKTQSVELKPDSLASVSDKAPPAEPTVAENAMVEREGYVLVPVEWFEMPDLSNAEDRRNFSGTMFLAANAWEKVRAMLAARPIGEVGEMPS